MKLTSCMMYLGYPLEDDRARRVLLLSTSQWLLLPRDTDDCNLLILNEDDNTRAYVSSRCTTERVYSRFISLVPYIDCGICVNGVLSDRILLLVKRMRVSLR